MTIPTSTKGRNVVVDVSLLIGSLTLSFMLGGHLMNDSIHEAEAPKNARIYTVLDREIKPELRSIKDDVKELNDKMDRLLKKNGG